MSSKRRSAGPAALIGFLARLRRDTRGNALAIMAAMLIPLAGFSGSAIDMGRLYAVKSRLQQACDAGVLAGRKSMTGTTLDTSSTGQAQTFFANNFHGGWFKSSSVSFTPSVTSDNQVAGTASATVPMTIMGMFGQGAKTITVSCQARYDVADANIMFVLDTTGSMACSPGDSDSNCDSYDGGNVIANADGTYSVTEKSDSRISGVRSAVLNFFDKVTGQADPTTNFRFGFVPFSASVNVGKLLQPLGYMASTWNIQSRVQGSGEGNYASATTSTKTTTAANCPTSTTTRSPSSGYDSSTGTATVTTYSWTRSGSSSNGTCTTTSQPVGPNWIYKQVTGLNVSQYVAGSTVDNPAQITSATSTWGGCVEERGGASAAGTTSFDAANPTLDLDVDTAPSSGTANSFWGPLWPDISFARLSTNETTAAQRTITYRPYNSTTMADYLVYEQVPCPLAASRLSTITLPGGTSSSGKSDVRTKIQNYMLASNGYRPWGKTYLDYGMTWGTRLLSPSGMFKADTVAWPGHNPPNNFLIFLTDGNMETDCYAYSGHGMEQYDQRALGSSCSQTNLDTNHSSRFSAACTIAKNHNITVFVILFGQSVTALPTMFTQCASPGQAYYATSTDALNTAFSNIAQQVAMLRISK